jgi:hypothetical protein
MHSSELNERKGRNRRTGGRKADVAERQLRVRIGLRPPERPRPARIGEERPLEGSVRISPERSFAAPQGQRFPRQSPKALQQTKYHASALQGVTPARKTRLVAGEGVDYDKGRRRF